MIAEIDKDGSGQLEFDEFFSMMTTRPSENETWEEIHKVFITFDTGRTGFVALKDLRRIAKDLGEMQDDNTLQDMIERADYDQDGLVSEEEFYNLMTKKSMWYKLNIITFMSLLIIPEFYSIFICLSNKYYLPLFFFIVRVITLFRFCIFY